MSQSLIESVSPSVRARVTERDVAHLKAYNICDMFTIEKKSVRMDMSLRGDVIKSGSGLPPPPPRVVVKLSLFLWEFFFCLEPPYTEK